MFKAIDTVCYGYPVKLQKQKPNSHSNLSRNFTADRKWEQPGIPCDMIRIYSQITACHLVGQIAASGFLSQTLKTHEWTNRVYSFYWQSSWADCSKLSRICFGTCNTWVQLLRKAPKFFASDMLLNVRTRATRRSCGADFRSRHKFSMSLASVPIFKKNCFSG